ncbi:MAG: endonuclease/exonuclease/phosphatase family protein [Sphingobacteriales bacterium]|nr:MAG: endonuclease/exonuclease/phosphatase family protein [Sphingobacteriales bacterium]
MRIISWNIMRPTVTTKERNQFFLDTLSNQQADIMVLTETNDIINPGEAFSAAHSLPLSASFEKFVYKPGERRVSLYSRYPFGEVFSVSDPYTSVCQELLTPMGSLIIYATIIGVTGGKDARFKTDLAAQQKDIATLANSNRLCVIGDYNISFSGYTYPDKTTRQEFADFLSQNHMELLTGDIPGVPDHIAISRAFMSDKASSHFHDPIDSKISDHGIVGVHLV